MGEVSGVTAWLMASLFTSDDKETTGVNVMDRKVDDCMIRVDGREIPIDKAVDETGISFGYSQYKSEKQMDIRNRLAEFECIMDAIDFIFEGETRTIQFDLFIVSIDYVLQELSQRFAYVFSSL